MLLRILSLVFAFLLSYVPCCMAEEQVILSQTQYQQLTQNSITLRTELTNLQMQITKLKNPSYQLVQQLATLDNKLAISEEQLRVAQQNLTISQNELQNAKNSMKAISTSLEMLKKQYNEEIDQHKRIERKLRLQRTLYVVTSVILGGLLLA